MGDPDDQTTEAGALRMFEEMKTYASKRFREDGDLAPQAFMLETRDAETGEAHPSPQVTMFYIASDVINDHGSKGAKAKLALMLRGKARRSDAIAFCWMSEAWGLNTHIKPHGSWENAPGRTEVLHLTFQHKALWGGECRQTHATVTRDGRGKPALGPWSIPEASGGKFAGVLPSAADEAAWKEAAEGMLESGAALSPAQRRYHLNRACERLIADGIPRAHVEKHIQYVVNFLRERGHEVDEKESPL